MNVLPILAVEMSIVFRKLQLNKKAAQGNLSRFVLAGIKKIQTATSSIFIVGES